MFIYCIFWVLQELEKVKLDFDLQWNEGIFFGWFVSGKINEVQFNILFILIRYVCNFFYQYLIFFLKNFDLKLCKCLYLFVFDCFR